MLIRTEEFRLKKERRVALLFPYNADITEMLRSINDLRWSHEHNFWHIPYSNNYLNVLNEKFISKLRFISKSSDIDPIKNENQELLEKFVKHLEFNGYCQVTICDYKFHIKKLFRFCDHISVYDITPEMCRDFLIQIVEVEKLSVSYQSHVVSAIKRFLNDFLGMEIDDYYIPRPKRPKQIPIIISEEEITQIFRQICDIRDKCMIYLVYSAGLKVGEIVYIKLEHIDTIRMKIYITSAKGDKDRYVILSKKVLKLLKEYYQIYEPKVWLFEKSEGKQFNKNLIQKRFREAVQKSGINKRVTLTMLKNSFAVHLIERGIDIRYIQKMLGLKHSVSAIRFLKASKREIKEIESPLDRMDV